MTRLRIFQLVIKECHSLQYKFDKVLFETIFSDAQVIDVDFSRWDRLISICVVADHIPSMEGIRNALLMVDFIRVRKFNAVFNHHKVQLDHPTHHFQWPIDDFEIAVQPEGIAVRLFGNESFPVLEIECESIDMRPIPNSLLDHLFPKWNAPYRCLVLL